MPFIITKGVGTAAGYGFGASVGIAPANFLAQFYGGSAYNGNRGLFIKQCGKIVLAENRGIITTFQPNGSTVVSARRVYPSCTTVCCFQVTKVVADSAGNLYQAGTYNSCFQPGTLVKVSCTGSVLKAISLSDSACVQHSEVTSVAITSSGNVIAAVGDVNSGKGSLVSLTSGLSTTPNWGVGISQNFYACQGFANIVLDSSDNIYGFYFSGNPVLMKFSSSGSLTTQRAISGINWAASAGIALDSSNNIFASGAWGSYPYPKLGIAKFSSALTTINWQYYFYDNAGGLTTAINPGNVAVDSSGNVYVVGEINNPPLNVGAIFKFNNSGTLQWARQIYFSTTNYGCVGIEIYCYGTNFYLVFDYAGNNNQNIILCLPQDGSKTGTYSEPFGTYFYSVYTTYTQTTSSGTNSAGALTTTTTPYTITCKTSGATSTALTGYTYGTALI
jgi:hypothetical protein